jgi:ADP-heptose:LPS heptosyltransferase
MRELGYEVDLWLCADYPQTSELLRPWNVVRQVLTADQPPALGTYTHVVPASPPYYWSRFRAQFRGIANLVPRPPDSLYHLDEQEFYFSFARCLGFPPGPKPFCSLPIFPAPGLDAPSPALVLAPGCKTGEMAFKRWPHFPQLAEAFADVAIVGTRDDLRSSDGTEFRFPRHARDFVGHLSLRQTAELMAGAGVVVANDSGLGHVAAALGTPTVLLFGPTPDKTLGPFPPNVTVLRRGLACEPCWFGARFRACAKKMTCLEELSVEMVVAAIEQQGLKRSANLEATRQLSEEIQKATGPVG